MAATNDSFLPEDYVEKRAQRRTNVISLLLFLIVMGGVVGAFYVTDRQRAGVLGQQRQIEAQYAEAARRLEQLDELQQRKQQMIRKARITATLLERVPRTIVLAELINNMPQTLSLLEMELQTKVLPGAAPLVRTALDKARADAKRQQEQQAADPTPAVQPTEVSLRLVGVAPTDVQVAQFMTALGRAPLFSDVNLAFSEEIVIEKQALRKFRIEMMVNQSIDPRTYEPKLVRRELKQNPMADKVEITPQGQLRLTRPTGPRPDASVVPTSD